MVLHELPQGINYGIDVSPLGQVFFNVRNSYKFFFFLAILDWFAHKFRGFGELQIDIEWLASRMAINAWYPAVYYGLSLGSQDSLGKILLKLRDSLTYTEARFTASPQEVLASGQAKALEDEFIRIGKRYVPFRFIRPFFANELTGASDHTVNRSVAEKAKHAGDRCMYKFVGSVANPTAIQLSPAWAAYLLTHQRLLKEWTHWHLSQYLSRENPFATEIPSKLVSPSRKSLSPERNVVIAWSKSLIENPGGVRCLYTDKLVGHNDFALDHFLPRAFVAHDRFWNLVPSDPTVNSAKLASIPNPGYIPKVVAYHHKMIDFLVNSEHSKESLRKVLTQYENDLSLDLDKGTPSESELAEKYDTTLVPLMQTARIYGFPIGWQYKELSVNA